MSLVELGLAPVCIFSSWYISSWYVTSFSGVALNHETYWFSHCFSGRAHRLCALILASGYIQRWLSVPQVWVVLEHVILGLCPYCLIVSFHKSDFSDWFTGGDCLTVGSHLPGVESLIRALPSLKLELSAPDPQEKPAISCALPPCCG